MDLACTSYQECTQCLSKTVKYDLKSQLFKCFNSRCGYIQTLTLITYDDETVVDMESKNISDNTNTKRFVYGNDDEIYFQGLNNIKDPNQQVNQNKPKINEQTRQEIKDIEDRIRNEVNICKKLIKRWCDFLDDKKILFEIIDHFLEIVHLDNNCTVPSVKRKAASSFCFVILKYIGIESDLEEIAKYTGVPLPEIVKEQEKIRQLKFPKQKIDSDMLPINFNQNEEDNNKTEKWEWEKICTEFCQKVIYYNLKQIEKSIITQRKSTIDKQKYPQSFKDVKVKDYLTQEDFTVFQLFEKNIKQMNPKKTKYEKNKVSASIVLTFCILTTIEELHLSSVLELSVALNLQEKTITKYYKKYIYPFKDEIIPKQDVWPRRQNLSALRIFV